MTVGRGNVCVFGDYEGLFYIDNDHFYVYREDCENAEEPEVRLMGNLDYGELTSRKWLYDEVGTSEEYDGDDPTNYLSIYEYFKQINKGDYQYA